MAVEKKPLTKRQLQVLQLLCTGVSKKEIARALEISPITVKFHLAKVIQNLEVKGRVSAVIQAQKNGYCDGVVHAKGMSETRSWTTLQTNVKEGW